MKTLSIAFFTLLLAACSTTTVQDQKVEVKNTALVQNTTFDPIFSVKTKYTVLLKIDGAAVKYKTEHEIAAGEHELTVRCQYFESASFVLTGERTFKIDLKKGNKYKLIPLPAKHEKTGEPTCFPVAKNI